MVLPFKRGASRRSAGSGPETVREDVGRDGQELPTDVVPLPRTGDGPPSDALTELLPPAYEPIVVDLPVASFAPRPPRGPGYQPDSVVDGWSTPDFDVRLASVRGYSHRYYRRPRQDNAAIVHHEATGGLVFAVADGVGNAELSDLGSRMACDTAVDVVTATLGPTVHVDWQRLARSIAARLEHRARCSERPPLSGTRRAAGDYATTLVAGHVLPTDQGPIATMIQIGDSGAWVLDRAGFHDVLAPKSSPGSPITGQAVTALPDVPEEIVPYRVRLAPGSVLLVGTDGIGDPLGDGCGLVGDLFRRVLREPPSPLEFAHAVDFSRETFDDDRTLIAIWPRSDDPSRPVTAR